MSTEPTASGLSGTHTQELLSGLIKALQNLKESSTGITITPPIFRGTKGEDPNIHILKCEDYFSQLETARNKTLDKEANFKYTLDGEPREWFNEWFISIEHTLEDVTREFLREYSVQGNSRKALKSHWMSLQFDPSKITVTKFIRNLKSTATQLGIKEKEMLETLKDSVPREARIIMSQFDTFSQGAHALKTLYKDDEHLVKGKEQLSSLRENMILDSLASFRDGKTPTKRVRFDRSDRDSFDRDRFYRDRFDREKFDRNSFDRDRYYEDRNDNPVRYDRDRFSNSRERYNYDPKYMDEDEASSEAEETGCFNCGKHGHWSRECPENKRNRKQPRNQRNGSQIYKHMSFTDMDRQLHQMQDELDDRETAHLNN
jgi:hypothetical protein